MAILLPLIQSSSRNLCSKAARNALQIEGVVAPRKPMVACLAQLRCRVNSRDAIYPSHDVALAPSAGGRLKPLKLLARESIVKVPRFDWHDCAFGRSDRIYHLRRPSSGNTSHGLARIIQTQTTYHRMLRSDEAWLWAT